MKLLFRILFALFALSFIIFIYFANFIKNDFSIRYLESVEESLIDLSGLFAVMIEQDSESGHLTINSIASLFEQKKRKSLNARIYRVSKKSIDVETYICDMNGRVVYDSTGKNTGKDFSQWNDVYLTLRGLYGARMSQTADHYQDALYVASPITVNGLLLGSVTVVKPKRVIEEFKKTAQFQIFSALIIAAAVFLMAAVLLAFWIVRPVRRLSRYVQSVQSDKSSPLPDLGNTEIGELGREFARLLQKLESKEYIESYITSLTHEIKSPLSSIRAASELLQADLTDDEKQRFYRNIESDSVRIEGLINKLLELSVLEHRSNLTSPELLELQTLIENCASGFYALTQKRNIRIGVVMVKPCTIRGERILLEQAVYNCVENAVKYSPDGSEIRIELDQTEKSAVIRIIDRGSGIPDYALGRIFDRFYSLPAADGGRKGFGLGLAFVRRIMSLHGGRISIVNNPDRGVTAEITIPLP
jgi:two-component system sensor histidine kinase CreC